MLMMRTLLATVCCIFGSWGLVIELNFGSDFEHKVWSRFWSWSSGKIFELEFGQHFAAGNDICRVMKLNLGCDTLVSWTQPSGQLCLWQCCICIMLYNKDKKGYNRRLIWYSYLVLGTRSAAKFEKVPSTSKLSLGGGDGGMDSLEGACKLEVQREWQTQLHHEHGPDHRHSCIISTTPIFSCYGKSPDTNLQE